MNTVGTHRLSNELLGQTKGDGEELSFSQSLACKLCANTKHPGSLLCGVYMYEQSLLSNNLWIYGKCENKIIHIVDKYPPHTNEPNWWQAGMVLKMIKPPMEMRHVSSVWHRSSCDDFWKATEQQVIWFCAELDIKRACVYVNEASYGWLDCNYGWGTGFGLTGYMSHVWCHR